MLWIGPGKGKGKDKGKRRRRLEDSDGESEAKKPRWVNMVVLDMTWYAEFEWIWVL